MLVFITIHNEGFSQVKETKVTALRQATVNTSASEWPYSLNTTLLILFYKIGPKGKL